MDLLDGSFNSHASRWHPGMALPEGEVPGSFLTALTALMAALHAALASIPGPFGFRSWMIIILPLEGMMLGPGPAAISAMIGGSIGCVLRGEGAILPIVAFSEPLGAASAGLAFKGRWKKLLALYSIMLAAYFAHPYGRALPAWCLWDIYVATSIAFVASLFSYRAFRHSLDAVLGRLAEEMPILNDLRAFLKKGWSSGSPAAVALSAFMGLEADSLARIFVFIPLCFYVILGVRFEAIVPLWYLGALATPLEALLSILLVSLIGPPVFKALEHKGLKCPLT